MTGAASGADRATGHGAIPSGSVVLKRPHYRRLGNELYFLISRRPSAHLSSAEAEVWDALGEKMPISQLRGLFPQEADRAVARFVELDTCEIAPEQFPEGRKRVLVVEPHSDDAVLSVGGAMWTLRDRAEFTIATLASRSNFTSYFFLDRAYHDVEQVSALRAAEGELAAQMIGGRYLTLGREEATVRYRQGEWSLEWFRRHQTAIQTSIGRIYPESELGPWARAVRELLERSDAAEWWLPLGLGRHCDHQLARDAWMEALTHDPGLAEGRTIKLYGEVPYLLHHPEYNERLIHALREAGAELTWEPAPVDKTFDQKLRLASIYASQFKLKALQEEIEASARAGTVDGGKAEWLWRMDRPPATLDRRSLRPDGEVLRERAPRLKAWFARHQRAERIRLLLLIPSGRWEDDAAILLDRFPRATFDLFVSSAGVAEVREFHSQRFRVHEVGRGTKPWVSLALRLAVSRPAPTVFVSGPNRHRAARWLAKLWPLSDPLVVPSMDQFLFALDPDGAGQES